MRFIANIKSVKMVEECQLNYSAIRSERMSFMLKSCDEILKFTHSSPSKQCMAYQGKIAAVFSPLIKPIISSLEADGPTMLKEATETPILKKPSAQTLKQ